MPQFNNDLKLKAGLERYFSLYHFKDGGYHLKWFTIKVGFVHIPLPNIPARVRAVKIHDLHHLLTGYNADLKGEAEIGAWEIASGCGKYYVAWFLNFGSFFYGMFFFPKPLFKAFLRGRKAEGSLYKGYTYNEALLERSIGQVQEELNINSDKKNSVFDFVLFFFYVVLFLAFFVLTSYFLCRIFGYLFFVISD